MEVNDMLNHSVDRELLSTEQLDMFDGGYVKFRHGSTDDKLEHACNRRGVPHKHVNPSGSSSKCPVCSTGLIKDKHDQIERCPQCDYEAQHDYGANATLGRRALAKAGKKIPKSAIKPPTIQSEAERSARKRRQRIAKMKRRKARGARIYHVKDEATPRRPRKKKRMERRHDNIMTLSELRDLIIAGFKARCSAGDFKAVNGFDYAGLAKCSATPLLPWNKTNSLYSSYFGWSTCYAFFDDLYIKWKQSGTTSPRLAREAPTSPSPSGAGSIPT
jgi:hypothetical protein